MQEELFYSETEKFVLKQIPGIQICYHRVRDVDYPDWPITLKMFLGCQQDYTKELKKVLTPEQYKNVNSAIQSIVKNYVQNGEMKGLNDFKVMSINQNLIRNRVSAKVYAAYQDGVDITKGLKSIVQSYSSKYCMRLTPQEERAICALYHAAVKDGPADVNAQNLTRDDIYAIAYTFFCLRVRKAYSYYEKALKACGMIEDGLLAAMVGFNTALFEYDFKTSLDTGMGPGRLNIPIRSEIKSLLHDANEFSISEATWRKIYAYDNEKHKEYTREELMKEFHAASSTVDMMLLYGKGGLVSLNNEIMGDEEKENSTRPTEFLGENESGYFLAETREVLDKVLDDDQRAVFDYIVFDRMTYKEVAEIMDLPERKVKYLYELCRKKLLPIYRGDDEQPKKKKGKKSKKKKSEE